MLKCDSFEWNDSIAKGGLIDVTPFAKEVRLGRPVAVTASLYSRLQPTERDMALGQTLDERVYDLLTDLHARLAIAREIYEPRFHRALNRETDIGTYSFDNILIANAKKRRLSLKAEYLKMNRRLFGVAIMDKCESFNPAGTAAPNVITSGMKWEGAIAKGELVDATAIAKEAGFEVPVALSASIYAQIEPSNRDAMLGQSYEDRLWDVFMDLRARVAEVHVAYRQIYRQWSPRFYSNPAPAGTEGNLSFNTVLVQNAQKHKLHLKAKQRPSGITIMVDHFPKKNSQP
jgi:hypothetical protein